MNSNSSSAQTIPSGCDISFEIGGRLHQPSPPVQAILIFIVIIHVLTFPFTAVLNALVMLAVKMESRLRAHKSNILLALLASTDFMVGIIFQPAHIALIITILLDGASSGVCALQAFVMTVANFLIVASLIHLVLISIERYLAMKHPFAYITLVTEVRLLFASALAWLMSLILYILVRFVDKTVFLPIHTTLVFLCIAFVVFCHIAVYRETRRHEQQIAAQQVTQEAREQFENNKKACKLTSIIIVVVILCFIPIFFARSVLVRHRSEISLETTYVFFLLAGSISSWNSLLNPIIYAVRIRDFRIAFIKLTCRTVNFAEAEEIEMRIFGAPNAVVPFETGQDQRNVEQTNMNNSDCRNNDSLPQTNSNHLPCIMPSS